MRMSLQNLDWSKWLYGLFSGFISGGAGAVVSGITVSAMSPQEYNMGVWKFYILVFAVFMVNGTLTMLAFLHQNPLPPVITTTTVTVTEKSGDITAVNKIEQVKTTPQGE